MRSVLKAAAILAFLLGPTLAIAGSEDAGDRCPAGSAGRDFDGLLLCVPQDKGRYQLTEDGVGWMAWQEDAPVTMPDKDAPATGDALQMTLALVWIGDVAVGMADKAAGKKGFDRFMTVLAASILKGAQSAASSDAFATDVPMDESGQTHRFQFTQVQPDLLQGTPDDEGLGVDFILIRPSSGPERPHLLLCSGGKTIASPTHTCMSMREVEGHRVGLMVTGTKLERSFRIAEEVVAELQTFVVRPAP
jgi:hypothetical protein